MGRQVLSVFDEYCGDEADMLQAPIKSTLSKGETPGGLAMYHIFYMHKYKALPNMPVSLS